MSEISNISSKAHDIDEYIDDPTNCKYYSVEELKMIPRKKAINILMLRGLTHILRIYMNSPQMQIHLLLIFLTLLIHLNRLI